MLDITLIYALPQILTSIPKDHCDVSREEPTTPDSELPTLVTQTVDTDMELNTNDFFVHDGDSDSHDHREPKLQEEIIHEQNNGDWDTSPTEFIAKRLKDSKVDLNFFDIRCANYCLKLVRDTARTSSPIYDEKSTSMREQFRKFSFAMCYLAECYWNTLNTAEERYMAATQLANDETCLSWFLHHLILDVRTLSLDDAANLSYSNKFDCIQYQGNLAKVRIIFTNSTNTVFLVLFEE